MMQLSSCLPKRDSFLHLKGKKEQICIKYEAPQLDEVAQVAQELGQAAQREIGRFTSQPLQKNRVLKNSFLVSLIDSLESYLCPIKV